MWRPGLTHSIPNTGETQFSIVAKWCPPCSPYPFWWHRALQWLSSGCCCTPSQWFQRAEMAPNAWVAHRVAELRPDSCICRCDTHNFYLYVSPSVFLHWNSLATFCSHTQHLTTWKALIWLPDLEISLDVPLIRSLMKMLIITGPSSDCQGTPLVKLLFLLQPILILQKDLHSSPMVT